MMMMMMIDGSDDGACDYNESDYRLL